jgi:putative flippase GtrA
MNFLVKCKQQLEERKLWEVFIYLFFGGLTTIVNIAVHFTC